MLLYYTLDLSRIDYTRELLNAIEQHVALFDYLLILCILDIRSIGLDYTIDLVDYAIEPSGRDET